MENQEKKPESPQNPVETDVGGRPSKYLSKYNSQAYKLCLLGAIDKDLADFFEVAESTINGWKINFPKFSESIKKGKTIADAEIAKSLFHRAKGYNHRDVDIRSVNSEIVITPLTKHYTPDTMACIYWMNNRQRENWIHRQDFDHTSNGKPLAPPVFQVIDDKTKALGEQLVAGGGRESQAPEAAPTPDGK
jgi:hypothetical protein